MTAPETVVPNERSRYILEYWLSLQMKTSALSFREWSAACSTPVLGIQNVFPGSEFFPSRIRIKEFKFLTQQIVSKLLEIWSGLFIMFIPDPDPDFLLIPDPGVKKATDPGSVSATLLNAPFKIWNVRVSTELFFDDPYYNRQAKIQVRKCNTSNKWHNIIKATQNLALQKKNADQGQFVQKASC
jgi:hypothetical protein